MANIKAIPLYLSGDEAYRLYEILDDFFKNDCSNIELFTFIIGQSAFAEDTYIKIQYDGIDDCRVEVL